MEEKSNRNAWRKPTWRPLCHLRYFYLYHPISKSMWNVSFIAANFHRCLHMCRQFCILWLLLLRMFFRFCLCRCTLTAYPASCFFFFLIVFFSFFKPLNWNIITYKNLYIFDVYYSMSLEHTSIQPSPQSML